MKKIFCSIVVLVSCFFFYHGVLAEGEVAGPASKTWKEFTSPEKLIDIKEFLDGGYQEAFWCQVGEVNHQSKVSPATPGCSDYWAQLAARYLAWHLEFKEYFCHDSDEGLSGESDFYVISLTNNSKNDLSLDALGEGENLFVMAYDPRSNQLRVDKRFSLPPGIWMVLLNHQEHHAADDICTNKNKPVSEIEALTQLDAAAIADGIHTWKLFRDDFLKIWTEKGLDSKPEYIVAKMYLAGILVAEPLFEKDLNNRKIKYLKEYSRKLFLRQ